jgi:hypothetical protein
VAYGDWLNFRFKDCRALEGGDPGGSPPSTRTLRSA